MEQVTDTLPDAHHEHIIEEFLEKLAASNLCVQRCGLTLAILSCARHALLRSLTQNPFTPPALLPQLLRDYVNIADEDTASKEQARQRLCHVRMAIALLTLLNRPQELGRRVYQQSVARALHTAHSELYRDIGPGECPQLVLSSSIHCAFTFI